MTANIIDGNDGKIAVIKSDTPIINDGQSALDLMASLMYEHDCRKIAVNKAAVNEDFFRLSTGVAGEIAQKIANYRFHIAIIGDFSVYTSKPLRDYIYESNNGQYLYFAADEDEALKKLGAR